MHNTDNNNHTELPLTMQAVVAYAPGDYRLEEVGVPKVGEGEVLIKVEACGICAGDLKAYEGAPSFWGDETQPAYIKAPMIPGHEFIGHVMALGEGVKNLEVGDRVISEPLITSCQMRFRWRKRFLLNPMLVRYMPLSVRRLNWEMWLSSPGQAP